MQPSLSRRAFVGLAATGLAGCTGAGSGGGSPTGTDNPAIGEAIQRGDLTLTSAIFDDGEAIPREYGRHERDVNPPLRISGVPNAAVALVLIMDDPDAVEPAGKVWLHWLVWNIGADTTEIPEDWQPTDAVVGENDFGERDYGGPAPPDREHTYRFKLYAVDRLLDLSASTSKAEVGEAMAGHLVGRTQLEGTYAP